MDGLHLFGVAAWHEASVRTFVVELPYPLCEGAPLLDEAGAPLGQIVRTWTALNGRRACRIRITAVAMRQRPDLRADLLAHRLNLAIDDAGRLLLAPRIEAASLAAAPTQRHALWLTPPRIVASRG